MCFSYFLMYSQVCSNHREQVTNVENKNEVEFPGNKGAIDEKFLRKKVEEFKNQFDHLMDKVS